ncbi:hypothetical protein [Occallatibacter savannae]|uniref:hypothetical protein n=1 Tax=Occallatibacter savannae TaxID=1002691 RepID=UPI000D692DAE|nr:hypothetical protein [Occallatibacter savannae]
MFKKISSRARGYFIRPMMKHALKSLLLQGKLASLSVRERKSISSLVEVEFTVFSQWGEDGIIDWLIERLDLPSHLQTFIEFGVELYEEANTRFLLENRNWRGLVMDGDPRLRESLIHQGIFWRHDIRATTAFITRENINQLIQEAGLDGDIGLLSIDIDGNDYWVWEAITAVNPVIIVCEYNAVFGDIWPISIPYDSQFSRTAKHFSNLYFGASIRALESLAKRKGFEFLGSNNSGGNAFFVRHDYAARLKGAIANRNGRLSYLRESRNETGCLTFLTGEQRLKMISELPVINVETGETVLLCELPKLYSDAWTV